MLLLMIMQLVQMQFKLDDDLWGFVIQQYEVDEAEVLEILVREVEVDERLCVVEILWKPMQLK